MKTKAEEYLKTQAVRAGAKSAMDFELFENIHWQRKSMRAAARKSGGADEAAVNMARIYHLMLTHGRFFEPASRPRKFKTGPRNQCYGNSLDLVLAHRELSYCEGLVVVERIPIPVEHGWCVTSEGSVVDVTLKKPALTYFGVVFNSLYAVTRDLPALESVLIANDKSAVWRACS